MWFALASALFEDLGALELSIDEARDFMRMEREGAQPQKIAMMDN
jgi:hypothetical protein